MDKDTINFKGDDNEKHETEGIVFKWMCDAVSDCVFISEKGICSYQNLTARETLGYTDDEIKGLNISKLFTEKSGDMLKSNVLIGYDEPFNAFTLRKDGTEYYCTVKCKTIHHKDKTLRITTLKDLKDFKKEYKESKIRGKYFREIIDNIPGLVWFKDVEGRFLKVNKEFLKASGKKSFSEILGKTDDEIWNSEIAEKYKSDHEKIIHTRESIYTDEIVTIDGITRIYETYKKAVFDDNDNVIGTTGVAIDVTEKKQTEEKIKVSEARYRAMAQSANEAIITVDINGIIVDWNNSAKKIFGYGLEEIIGKPLTVLMGEKYYYHHLNKFNNIQLRKDSTVIGKAVEIEAIRKDGEIFPIELSLSKWESSEGLFFTGIIRDISEQKNALIKVEESDGFLENILNAVSEPIFVKNIEHKYVIVNDAYCNLIGYKKEDLIGRKDSEYFPESEVDVFIAKDNEVFKTGLSNVNEEPFTDREGKLHIIITKKSLYTNKKGDKFVVGVINDITKQKLFQKALEESEEKYKFIVENSSEGISVVENDKIVFTSDMYHKYSGMKFEGENLINAISKVVDKRDLEYVINEIARGRNEMLRNQTMIYRIRDKNDKTIWLMDEVKRIYDEFGNHIKSLIVSRDITERKIAEDKLIESERKLREAQTIAGIGNFETDLKSMTWTSSEILDDIFGLNDSFHYTINNWLAIIHSDYREKVADFLTKIRGGDSGFDIEYKFVRQNDGAERWARALGIVKTDLRNKPIKIIGTIQDITDNKNLEIALSDAKDKAEASSRLKTAFLNNISHEIRTPLNGILGFGELISQSGLTHEAKKSYFKNLQKSTKRLVDTITDYMDISLLVSGSMNVNKRDLKLSEFINGIFDEYKEIFNSKGINFSYVLPDEMKNFTLFSDHELLTKIMSHLLSNAYKFTKKGEVVFGLTDKRGRIEFFVSDTGIGIAKQNLSIIFENFSQESEGISRNYEGNGLGLSIVKGAVELLGGSINVVSEKDKGTELSFTIDSDDWKRSQEKNKLSDSISITKMPDVLIVEDDDINMYFLETTVKALNCKYKTATNGLEAVKVCKLDEGINLVLMDIKLPIMDGYTATAEIKKIRPDVVVIAVTAHAMAGDESKALESGCDGYLSKPITRGSLTNKIKEMGFDL